MRPTSNGGSQGYLLTLNLTLALATSLITLGLPQTAQAIVNIEGQRNSHQQKGVNGAVSLSFRGASGNTDKTSTSASGRLNWQHRQSSTLFIARYSYGESNQLRNTNKAFGHLRHTFRLSDARAIEVFVQAERNEFTRLSLRTLAGVGLRQTLHDGDKGQTHLGLGSFHSTEILDQRTGLSDNGTEKLWRANTYLTINYAINEQITLNSTSYYQPALENRHDYRLLEQASLKVALNDHLAIKLSLDISHDSQPPQTIESTDISYRTGLEYRF